MERLSDSAVHIEHAEDDGSNSNKTKKSQINNANSNGGKATKAMPDKIGGFKVNKEGLLSDPSAWKKLSYSEKTKYWEAKNKLVKEGVQFPTSKWKSNKEGESGKEADSAKDKAIKTQHRTINKLQEKLKNAGKEEKDASSDKTATKSSLNNLTFAEIVKKMPKENGDKIISYVKSKIKVTKTSNIRFSLDSVSPPPSLQSIYSATTLAPFQ